MIGFWSMAALLVAAVLTGLLRPLLRRPRGGGATAETVAVFRRQLAELEADAAQGRLAPEAADAARAEIARRTLAAADRDTAGAAPAGEHPAEAPWRIGAAVGIAGMLPAAAIALYLWVGAPFAIGGSQTTDAAMRAHETAEFAAAADTLAARLKADPGNLEDWVMLGRTSASLQRFTAAREAYRRAIALAPDRPQLHAELGEVLVLEAAGTVTPAAAAEFGQAGKDPRARYYLAEAALQHGDKEKGAGLLRALLADAPADAPWRRAVAQRLAEIAPPTAPQAGPTAQDVAAAQNLSPEARAAMIRSMVARLAARLQAHPEDKEGWTRLAHAYDVLGETDKAAAARRQATAAPPQPR
jgi:cytochrome c-type biogenesis protein CcmH